MPFAMTDDDDVAHRWLEALEAADIPAELHIEDGTVLATGSSVFPTGRIFASAIYIPPESREQAAALLIDLGWDGRQLGGGEHRGRGRSFEAAVIAAAVIAAGVLSVAILVALRGM
jgi:hypothetical protein